MVGGVFNSWPHTRRKGEDRGTDSGTLIEHVVVYSCIVRFCTYHQEPQEVAVSLIPKLTPVFWSRLLLARNHMLPDSQILFASFPSSR